MSDNPENAFAEEAREEALLSRTESYTISSSHTSQKKARTSIEEYRVDGLDETSPLLLSGDRTDQHQGPEGAGQAYQRAIDEPWTGAHGAADLPWYKRPSVLWLLPAFFPFCVAFGGMLVPRTYLVLDLICRDYLSDKALKDPDFHFLPVLFGQGENPQCRDWHVQQNNAWFNSYSDFLSGFFSAIVTPHIGALSDRVGRKKVIVWASVGGIITEVVTIIVGTNAETASVYWLLLGAFADGIFGSFTAGMAVTFAYASDCTAPAKRAVSFGILQGTLFTGIAIGPILAGYLIKLTGNVISVFYVVLGCHVFFITFITLLVPESLSKARQMIATEKHDKEMAETSSNSVAEVFRIDKLFRPLWVLRPTVSGSSPLLRRNLVVLATIDCLMFGVAMGTMRIIVIYAQFRFDWDIVDSSWYLSTVNIARVSCLFFLLPFLHWLFRGSTAQSRHKGSNRLDIGIIRFSIIFDLIGYLGYALTPSGSVMVLSGVIASIGGIGSPTLQSSITKHLPADRTGQVLGATGLLHAMSRVVAPLLFNTIYGLTVKHYAGIVFLCLAAVFVVAFILSWFLKPGLALDEVAEVHPETSQEPEAERVAP